MAASVEASPAPVNLTDESGPLNCKVGSFLRCSLPQPQ